MSTDFSKGRSPFLFLLYIPNIKIYRKDTLLTTMFEYILTCVKLIMVRTTQIHILNIYGCNIELIQCRTALQNLATCSHL